MKGLSPRAFDQALWRSHGYFQIVPPMVVLVETPKTGPPVFGSPHILCGKSLASVASCFVAGGFRV